MNSEAEEPAKQWCVCANCMTAKNWTYEEYRNNINCKCGCAVWSHDPDLGEARKMASWSKRVCGF
jgi:hypothetical protein